MWELWVKVCLRQNEDYNLGDSLSDSSEELLWSWAGGRGVNIYTILVKGYMCSQAHTAAEACC